MTDRIKMDNPELDALFDRYREHPESHVFAPLADACRKAGMLEQAVEIVDRGVAANPGYTSGFVVRGKCYYDNGDVDEAERSFERVLELDPSNLVALRFLGIILADRGDAHGAREHFKQILVLDPEDRGIREKLETLPAPDDDDVVELDAVEDEDFEGEAITLGKPDDDATTDELATITLADIYATQGYTDKAIRIYRDVLHRQPDNAAVREKLRALEGDGDGKATELEAATDPGGDDTRDQPGTESTESTGSTAPAREREEDAEELHFEEVPGSGAPGSPRRIQHPQTRRPRDPLAQPSHEDEPPSGPPIDERRSYEQFKRWLRNMSD
jgi:tetratricopeptide (TPR) repeat protein